MDEVLKKLHEDFLQKKEFNQNRANTAKGYTIADGQAEYVVDETGVITPFNIFPMVFQSYQEAEQYRLDCFEGHVIENGNGKRINLRTISLAHYYELMVARVDRAIEILLKE